MKQGTVSITVGCHSPFHSFLVLLAWRKLYGEWPKFWELCCIFLHDVGHWGLNYLDDYYQKQQHWKLGAKWAEKLFGWDGFALVAGHCTTSGAKLSKLYKPDKYSWLLAPTWWLWLNTIFEPMLWVNCDSRIDGVRKFQTMVRKSIESGEYRSTHDMFLERQRGSRC